MSGLFETRLYDGVPEMLDALRASGVVLAVATSKPQDTAERVLDHLGLAPHFTVVAGATYDGTRRTKADVIGHALERLGVAAGPAVVMIGDRHHDIEGAAAYGIDTIAVAWGYGSADEHRDAGAWATRRATRATWWVSSPADSASSPVARAPWAAPRTRRRVPIRTPTASTCRPRTDDGDPSA